MLKVQRLILRKAKIKKIPMSSGEAKKLAMTHLGLLPAAAFDKHQKEIALEQTFSEGMRSALPRYRNL